MELLEDTKFTTRIIKALESRLSELSKEVEEKIKILRKFEQKPSKMWVLSQEIDYIRSEIAAISAVLVITPESWNITKMLELLSDNW